MYNILLKQIEPFVAVLSTIVVIRHSKLLHKSVRFNALANTIGIIETMIIRPY
jgi:hypothetical protein